MILIDVWWNMAPEDQVRMQGRQSASPDTSHISTHQQYRNVETLHVEIVAFLPLPACKEGLRVRAARQGNCQSMQKWDCTWFRMAF